MAYVGLATSLVPKWARKLRYEKSKLVNNFLCAKIYWRFICNQKGLWSKTLKIKNLSNKILESSIQESDQPKGSSIWNITIRCKDLIDKHIFWVINIVTGIAYGRCRISVQFQNHLCIFHFGTILHFAWFSM